MIYLECRAPFASRKSENDWKPLVIGWLGSGDRTIFLIGPVARWCRFPFIVARSSLVMAALSKRSSRRISPPKADRRVRKGTSRQKAKSRKVSSNGLDRPFAPEIETAARKVVSEYQIVVESKVGHWYGRGLELPHGYGDG